MKRKFTVIINQCQNDIWQDQSFQKTKQQDFRYQRLGNTVLKYNDFTWFGRSQIAQIVKQEITTRQPRVQIPAWILGEFKKGTPKLLFLLAQSKLRFITLIKRCLKKICIANLSE